MGVDWLAMLFSAPMSNVRFGSVVLLVTTALSCGGDPASPTRTQSPIVDRTFVPSGNGSTPKSNPTTMVGIGQTFTVGANGGLTGADLFLAVWSGAVPTDVLVEVRTTSGNLPTSTVVGRGTVAAANIPNVNSSPSLLNANSLSFSVHVDFASSISVSAGQVLALVCFLTTSLPPPTVGPGLLGADSSMVTYSGGQAVVGTGESWFPFGVGTVADFFFRTYVARSS
jgi:hypothetical protein